MNPPRLTAEAAVYRTSVRYRTDLSGACDTRVAVAPAAAAQRIAGLEAVSDYINRMDLAWLKQKLTLPPSWGGRSWTPERADRVWEAIALHTSAGIASRMAAEIALVHLGAGLDFLGLGYRSGSPAVS